MHKKFVICIIMPNDIKKLERVYKRFVIKNLKKLKQLDNNKNKMFRADGSFLELKGSSFNRTMKLEFLDYFCRNNLFRVKYIVLDNDKLDSRFIENKARTFNYLMKMFLISTINKDEIIDKEIHLNIDERNIKTGSKFSLEDYLNQELKLDHNIIDKAEVKYYDSSKNKLIQVADVFANIKYSNYLTNNNYREILNKLHHTGYILNDFTFPQNKKNKT